jgi:hypothetical protein
MHDHAEGLRIHNLPPSGERLPLFIVGDVHGCAQELSELIAAARRRLSTFQLVLVGDLFTKGPDPVGVYELLREHNAICIKGNHDWALLASINQAFRKGISTLPEHSQQTLHLIRHHKRAITQFLGQMPHALISRIMPENPRTDWESSYPLQIVHAGIDPTAGLMQTTERMLLTARYVRWDRNPDGSRRLALVPLSYRKESMAIAEKRASDGERDPLEYLPTDRFRWHELHTGPELIVFGHDARQGLFRKTLASGRPICVGVDTGCTYGRALTGYFPELDDAVQVPAHRQYFSVSKNHILLRGGKMSSGNPGGKPD